MKELCNEDLSDRGPTLLCVRAKGHPDGHECDTTIAGYRDEIVELRAAIEKALVATQSWRDSAFGSQHMAKLKSDTLEECAAEIEGILKG